MSPRRTNFDLLVLGGGVIGLACARAIQRRHPKMTVGIVDAPTQAMPASRAAAGMLAPYAEFGEDTPLARACEQSLQLYDEFLSELLTESRIPVSFVRHGTLIPETREEKPRFAARLAQYTSRRIDFHLIEGDALRRVEPVLHPDIVRAIWLPEALVNSRSLHTALREAVVRAGATWIDGRAVCRHDQRSRITGIELADGTHLKCGTLLAATGAWSNEVAALLDMPFDVRPIKGQMIRVASPNDWLYHVVHLKAFYLAPRPGFGIIIGSTMEDKGFDTRVDDEVVREFLAIADEVAPGVAAFPLAEAWAGLRPHTDDGLPIIGHSARWQNVLVATGHFRNGILLTPLTGEIIAEFFDDPASEEWKEFSPRRFKA